MHELFVLPGKGSKYDKDYLEEWTVELCPDCNLNKAEANRDRLIAHNVHVHGLERMTSALEVFASRLKLKTEVLCLIQRLPELADEYKE